MTIYSFGGKITSVMIDRIIDMIRNGKTIKFGHYVSGYEYFSYDAAVSEFIWKTESTACDIYNPEITISRISEKELRDMLQKCSEAELLERMV